MVGGGGGLASPLTLSKLRWGASVVVVVMVVMEVMEVEVDDVDVVGLALGLEGEEGRGMKLAAITQPGSVSGQEGRCSFISGGGLAGLALHSALKGVTAQISWVQSCLLASLLQVSRCTALHCTALHCTCRCPGGRTWRPPGTCGRPRGGGSWGPGCRGSTGARRAGGSLDSRGHQF